MNPHAERVLAYADRDANGCLVSRYSEGSHGYAQAWDGATTVLAHRLVWEAVNGEIPEGMTVDHRDHCNRKCIEVTHLRLLSNFENARRIDGLNWPEGECANGHPNSALVDNDRVTRVGLICAECKRLYIARSNWRQRHPDEPMPERLLLKREKSGKRRRPDPECQMCHGYGFVSLSKDPDIEADCVCTDTIGGQ